jgi:transketolase C-terminal domain/subunit
VCVTHDLLCNTTHVYFSDLIFSLSVIRDHTWFDLRRGRTDTYREGRACVIVSSGVLIICSGITALSELFNYSISATNILPFYVIYFCHVCFREMDR